MADYKEYDLLPCPWCENPVHVEGDYLRGYYVTCGHVACSCPARILHYTAEDAIKHWNDGSDIETISGIRTLPKRRNKE